MDVLTVSNSLTLTHTRSHILYTYKVIFCRPDSLQCYECAMLAASVFQLPSAPGSSSSLMVLGRENTTAAEGKDFCRLTIMSRKAVIVRCWEWIVCVRSHCVWSTKQTRSLDSAISCEIYCDIRNTLDSALLLSCRFNNVIFTLKWCSGGDTGATVSERVKAKVRGREKDN